MVPVLLTRESHHLSSVTLATLSTLLGVLAASESSLATVGLCTGIQQIFNIGTPPGGSLEPRESTTSRLTSLFEVKDLNNKC